MDSIRDLLYISGNEDWYTALVNRLAGKTDYFIAVHTGTDSVPYFLNAFYKLVNDLDIKVTERWTTRKRGSRRGDWQFLVSWIPLPAVTTLLTSPRNHAMRTLGRLDLYSPSLRDISGCL